MQQTGSSHPTGISTLSPSHHTAPWWAIESVADAMAECIESPADLKTTIRHGANFTLVSVHVVGIKKMGSMLLREKTHQAYQTIFDSIGARHLIRVWNFIPDLLEPVDGSPQRYLVFNAGRHDAFSHGFNGQQQFGLRVPTASGVGTSGDDLEIHALASDSIGTALSNPRQVDSFHYSQKYGTLPPCFARATAVDWPDSSGERLLVGGTASVRGEETMFRSSLEAQTTETFKNLAAIVATGLGTPELDIEDPYVRKDLLSRFHQVRTYFTQPESREAIAADTAQVFPHAEPLELAQAELCREGLLIEIEGWADLG